MKKIAPLSSLMVLLVLHTTVNAQDFFEDLRGESVPVVGRVSGNGTLLSARINAGDNSLKLNFFQIVIRNPDPNSQTTLPQGRISVTPRVSAPAEKYDEVSQGFGLNFKIKTEDGLGSVFSSSKFAPGFSGGGYYAWRKVFIDDANQNASFRYTILSGLYTHSQFRFYRPQLVFAARLSDFRPFDGFTFSLSHFEYATTGTNGRIVGGSLSVTKRNNYTDLDKVDVKRLSNTPYGTPKDSLQTVTLIDSDGSTYALDTPQQGYKENFQLQLRGYYACIPGSLDNRIALLTYPTLGYNFDKKYVTTDLNFGIHLLKKGQPTVTIGGLFIEFSDVFNSASDTVPFLKRSFNIGIMVGLNILSNTVNQQAKQVIDISVFSVLNTLRGSSLVTGSTSHT